MGDASGDPRRPTDSRMASGCGDSLVSKAVVTRTSSTGRKRPPLLRQLENDVSIMSMTEYQEDGFASAWEARDFLLNPNRYALMIMPNLQIPIKPPFLAV